MLHFTKIKNIRNYFIEKKEEEIRKQKKIIRNKISYLRNNLSLEQHKLKSELIKEKLIKLDEYIKANNIFIYYPFRSEIDTTLIIEHALKNNKKIILPKIDNNNLKLFFIYDIKNDLKIGKYGILEPDNSKCKEAIIDDIDLAIVPGLCFDLYFNRLGYGGGFYDKILSKLKKDIKIIALAFDLQLINKLPICKYDKKVNIIITESKIYRDNNIHE
jgi:5-formyltetrahydrofolate cyclo-ligase